MVAFEEATNFLTGKTTMEVQDPVEVTLENRVEPVELVALSGPGTELYVGWKDGELRRFDVRNLDAVELRESGHLWGRLR